MRRSILRVRRVGGRLARRDGGNRPMFRVTLVCSGLPHTAGAAAATDITREFSEHRHWHSRVTCKWDGTALTLQAENDFDKTGLATLDEFGDCITAYVPDPGDSGRNRIGC
jgi:hypothetical protein